MKITIEKVSKWLTPEGEADYSIAVIDISPPQKIEDLRTSYVVLPSGSQWPVRAPDKCRHGETSQLVAYPGQDRNAMPEFPIEVELHGARPY